MSCNNCLNNNAIEDAAALAADFRNNVALMHEVLHSNAATVQVETGERKTLRGVELMLIDSAKNLGYTVIGEYTDQVLTINNYNEAIRYNSELYKLNPSTDIPFTTSGKTDATWANDAPNFVAIGDAPLRSMLHAYDGANAIGGAAINFSSMNEAVAYTGFSIGKQVVTTGYNFANDGGYATFVVADASADFGILTSDGRFKLQRTSGHDFLLRAVRSGATPKIAAHRGFGCITAGEYTGNLTAVVEIVPENTRTAVRFAAEKGVWGVEGDTKITSDGVPVIFHDANLTRVSNGATSAAIESLTLAQIKAIDAGTYVSPKYAGEKILTYDEWLKACKQSGVVPIPEWSTAMSSANADLFLSLVRKYFGDQPQNVVLMSTSLANLQLIRSKDANISLMLGTAYGGGFSTEVLDGAYKLGNCAVILTGAAVTTYPGTVNAIKRRGLVLAHAITNSPARINAVTDAGADIIISDYYLG